MLNQSPDLTFLKKSLPDNESKLCKGHEELVDRSLTKTNDVTFLKKSEPERESSVRFYDKSRGRYRVIDENIWIIYFFFTFKEIVAREGVQTLNNDEEQCRIRRRLFSSFTFLKKSEPESESNVRFWKKKKRDESNLSALLTWSSRLKKSLPERLSRL